METLSTQFKDALSRIEIKGSKLQRAIEAHSEIRAYLEDDELLCSWGIDTVLIGSYARHTGIYPGKDVDIFSKFTKLDISANPNTVYDAVLATLYTRYKERVQPQPRSIKVLFESDGFAVDVVPAVSMGDRWGIPQRNREFWENSDINARWTETDPEKLAELTSIINSNLKVDGQGAYVPTVKLVRQARHQHLGDEKPGGLYFELLTYWAFVAGVQGESFAEIYANTLRSIAVQLDSTDPLVDPVLLRSYNPEPNTADRERAATKFKNLASIADEALYRSSRCQAAIIWRTILGSNERGPCFSLPPGCDEQGNEIKEVAPVAAIGAKEASGFA